MTAGGRRLPRRGALSIDDLHRLHVGRFDRLPVAERQIDVADHMLGMACVRRDLSVAPRCTQPQWRMGGVVIAVDQIVQHPRMVRIRGKALLQHRGRTHIDGRVAALIGEAEGRQSRKGSRIDVVRVGIEQRDDPLVISPVTGELVALAVKRFHCPKPRRLPRIPRLGATGLRRRTKPGEHRTRLVAILVRPERMVVGHRLTPEGHDVRGVRFLRLAERGGCPVIFEIVQQVETLGIRRGVQWAGHGSEFRSMVMLPHCRSCNQCEQKGQALHTASPDGRPKLGRAL
jgi:hypothetical protein